MLVVFLLFKRALFSSLWFFFSILASFLASVLFLVFVIFAVMGISYATVNPLFIFQYISPLIIAILMLFASLLFFPGLLLGVAEVIFHDHVGLVKFLVYSIFGLSSAAALGGFGFVLFKMITSTDLGVAKYYVLAVVSMQFLLTVMFLIVGILVNVKVNASSPESRRSSLLISDDARDSLWRFIVCPVIVMIGSICAVVTKGFEVADATPFPPDWAIMVLGFLIPMLLGIVGMSLFIVFSLGKSQSAPSEAYVPLLEKSDGKEKYEV